MTAQARQSTCVAVDGRGLLIEGPAGVGKSSLALALVDRGARLVGDDSVMLEAVEGALIARPHPNTRGLMEVRNLGLFAFPVLEEARVALVLRLDGNAPRHIEQADRLEIQGVPLPCLALWPDGAVLALKAELALARYGLNC
ncbi:MAG: HPr kinase/phosphatase C-terminal domain-containing protein [Novosphingobium sp.]|nr:HPr kinase/phosphatase C-terminal domain-containing protein [Novosphingobium sp.]